MNKQTTTCVVTFTVEDDTIDIREAAVAYLNSMTDQVCDENMATGVQIEVDYVVKETVMAVIWLSGNLSEGFRAFGPYSSMDEAFDAHDGQDGWGMTLFAPATTTIESVQEGRDSNG